MNNTIILTKASDFTIKDISIMNYSTLCGPDSDDCRPNCTPMCDPCCSPNCSPSCSPCYPFGKCNPDVLGEDD